MATDDTPTRVLAAAGPVFADKGFQAATVREICQAAGVNLASVNYHFRDKERLYIETVKRAAHLREAQVPMPELPPGAPPEVKLRLFIQTTLTRMMGDRGAPWQVRLMTREVLHPSSACEELVRDYFRPHFDRLQAILNELLPPDAPLHLRHQIGFSIIGQCMHYRVAWHVMTLIVGADEVAAHYSTDALAEHITQFSLAALAQYRKPGSLTAAPSESLPPL